MRLRSILILSVLAGRVDAQSANVQTPAAIQAIREQDLKRDLYALAGDEMRGREAGTLDEMRASMWLAEEMRKIGLQPHGEGGSWFQWWNMRRTRISTRVELGDASAASRLRLWTDITPTSNAAVTSRARRCSSATQATARSTFAASVAVVTLRPTAERHTYDHEHVRSELHARRHHADVYGAHSARRGGDHRRWPTRWPTSRSSGSRSSVTRRVRRCWRRARFAPAGRAGGGGAVAGRGGRAGGARRAATACTRVARASLGAGAAPRTMASRRDPPASEQLRDAVREHHRRGPRHRSSPARRVRALQLAPGPRRRALRGRRRLHLERRRRQRDRQASRCSRSRARG